MNLSPLHSTEIPSNIFSAMRLYCNYIKFFIKNNLTEGENVSLFFYHAKENKCKMEEGKDSSQKKHTK
jgi:hypothetical protein